MLEKLIGRTIVKVRDITEEESDTDWGWDEPGQMIILDDGTELVPSRDPEGNRPGHLLIFTNEGQLQ